MSDLVITEDREAVRHVILNRPSKRNALNEELVRAIGEALAAASGDDSVHCVVLRGNGPVFSAGMDVASLAALAGQPDQLRPFREASLTAWNLAEDMTKPTVCAIHGVCLGGALELALACDLRVMTEDAFVGLPETRLGLVPDLGGSSRLPQVVGLGRAKELIMTGRVIGAAEAERFGLANRIAAPDALEEVTQGLVDELLACAPIAVGLAKQLMDASARPALPKTLELEVAAQERCAATEDFAEGMRAVAERRAPSFRGR